MVQFSRHLAMLKPLYNNNETGIGEIGHTLQHYYSPYDDDTTINDLDKWYISHFNADARHCAIPPNCYMRIM